MGTDKMERRRSRTRSYYKVTAHYNGFRVADTRRRTKLRLKRRRLISSREDEAGGEGLRNVRKVAGEFGGEPMARRRKRRRGRKKVSELPRR